MLRHLSLSLLVVLPCALTVNPSRKETAHHSGRWDASSVELVDLHAQALMPQTRWCRHVLDSDAPPLFIATQLPSHGATEHEGDGDIDYYLRISRQQLAYLFQAVSEGITPTIPFITLPSSDEMAQRADTLGLYVPTWVVILKNHQTGVLEEIRIRLYQKSMDDQRIGKTSPSNPTVFQNFRDQGVGNHSYLSVVAESPHGIEGIMIFKRETVSSEESHIFTAHPHFPFHSIYVEGIATQLWNRRAYQGERRYQGLGKLLLAMMIDVSLHSPSIPEIDRGSLIIDWAYPVDGATPTETYGFYSGVGMTHFGLPWSE